MNETCDTRNEIPCPRGNPSNSEILKDLPRHLNKKPDDYVITLINQVPQSHRTCSILAQDIELINPNIKPIRQATYRLNPPKAKIMESEFLYLIDHRLAEPTVTMGFTLYTSAKT